MLWREFTGQGRLRPPLGEILRRGRAGTTPAGLASAPDSAPDPVLVGLAGAVALLNKADVPLDVPLGDMQYDGRVPDQRLPVPGGLGSTGNTNVVVGQKTGSVSHT